jgi:aminopeptidase N
MRFSLNVTGVPTGKTAIYARDIPNAAPSYMLALAIGNYAYQEIGTTQAGTHVGVYFFAADQNSATAATAHLRDIFNWYETTLGPYGFGDHVASVEANWGSNAFGGMEHHPFWHVASGAIGTEYIHAHEAAHGWFGDGVRMRCWEDFVLSEGTVSYLAARSIQQAVGQSAADAVWQDYQAQLDYAVQNGDTRAWPETCNAIDILHDPLWSLIPYMKGAFFYKAVAQQVGAAALDQVLSKFYADHRGGTASMKDMLDAIATQTGFDPTMLATGWLESLGHP